MKVLNNLFDYFHKIDWVLFLSLVPIILAGLVTMNSFVETDDFFSRQLIWLSVSLVVFFVASNIDFRFLRRTSVVTWLFIIGLTSLMLLAALGSVVKGAQSWFDFGGFSFQPAELVKLILIIILAKYFSRRHVEIRNIRHIIVSGVYALAFFLLVLLQPDFGSAIIIFLIWFGMIMVSGISKKHLLIVFLGSVVAVGGLWAFVFEDYQKQRIMTFIHPLEDIQGAGYNAFQSTVAVGSGELLGKGLGFGTQSRLKFLPEYQTDFIFAAFAEEWGFLGVILLFIFYGIVMVRILQNSLHGATNFEILYGLGLAIMFMSQISINIGMNIGLLPVTGITVPFMSYGGTHLLVSFLGLGILMSMRQYSRGAHRDIMQNEFLGI